MFECSKKLFDHSYHCINHVMISPCGNNFVFIHRYYYKSCRFDRLFIANSTNGDFKLLISSVVSHYAWIDALQLCYLKGPDGCFGWYINVNTKQFVQFPHFQGLGDGHPSISKIILSLILIRTNQDYSQLTFTIRKKIESLILGSSIIHSNLKTNVDVIYIPEIIYPKMKFI